MFVEDDFYGHFTQHRIERRLGAERADEGSVGQRREDLRRDSAADEHAAGRDAAKRQVARFGAIRLDKKLECLDAPLTAPIQSRARDRGRRGRVAEVDAGTAPVRVTYTMNVD